MTTRSSPQEIQQKAQFRLEQAELRKREAEKSLAEHKAKNDAVAAKTIRLRALRLAKEAEDAAHEVAAAEQRARDDVLKAALPKNRTKKKPKADAQV